MRIPACRARRWPSFVVLLCLVLTTGVPAATAQEISPAPAPYGEEMSEEELAAYDELVVCPPVGDYSFEQRPSRDAGSGSLIVECTYDGTVGIDVTWDKPDAPSPTHCGVPEIFVRDDRVVVFAGSTTRSVRVAVDYPPEPYDANRDQWQAAADQLALVVEPLGAVCPPPMTCIEDLPNLVITGGGEWINDADLRPDADFWGVGCWWGGETAEWSELIIDVWWVSPLQNGPGAITVCGIEDSFEAGIGFVDGPDNLAVGAQYNYRDPARQFDRALAEAQIQRFFDIVAPLARTCDDIAYIPKSSYYTDAPEWLADALRPGLAAGPPPVELTIDGSGIAAIEAPVDGSTAPLAGDDVTGNSAATPTPGEEPSLARSTPLVLRILGPAMVVFSLVMLAISLLLSGRETRIRPRLDVARIALAAGVAAVSVLLIGTETPLLVVVAAVGVGVGLGLWQGRNLVVRMAERGLVSKRSSLAIAAFAVGLIVIQIAGLLQRTGAITVGVALTVLSAALTTGLLVGRQPQVTVARAAGAAALVLLVAGAPLAPQRSDAQEAAPDLRDLITWEEVLIVGGVGANDQKPPITVAVPADFASVPDPVIATSQWEYDNGSTVKAYDLDETYTFALGSEAGTLAISYEGTGSITATNESGTTTDDINATADLASITLLDAAQPFGQSANLGGDRCGRTISTGAGDGAWLTYQENGEDTRGPGSTDAAAYVDCNIEGFTADAALAAAPAPPAPDGNRCPVYQEAYRALDDPAWQGPNDAGTVNRLLTDPNNGTCGAEIVLGSDARGARRTEIFYDMAPPDPALQATQLHGAYSDILLEFPLHEINPERVCAVGDDGIPVEQDGQDACQYRSYHKVDDGEITIWTDTATSDGPNTFVRGRFPWGHYRFRCHHCLVGDPEIARVLADWHEFGANWYGPTEAIGSTGAPTPTAIPAPTPDGASLDAEALGIDPDLIELVIGSDADEATRNAALAALVGLLGAAGMLGLGLAETGVGPGELASAFGANGRQGLTDVLDAHETAERARVEAETVIDEHGQPMRPGDDGLYDWGGERVDRSTVEERIADQRQAEAEQRARHEAIVAEQESDTAAETRFGDLRDQGEAADAEAAADLEAHLAHEAAQDRTRQAVADMLAEQAAAGGWDAIAERLDQGDNLSTEELQELREVLRGLTERQGAQNPLDSGSFGQDLLDEFAADGALVQEGVARVADATMGPLGGWAVRNPTTTARIGLGVVTGGFSEGVATVYDLHGAMERAAERAHAEGRDLTYQEAVLAAAWEAGPGMVLGHLAEMGLTAAGPALAQYADEAMEALGRHVDDFFASGRSLGDSADTALREAADAGTRRTARSAQDLADGHGLRWADADDIPTGPRTGGTRDMTPGTIVPQSRIETDFGMEDDAYRQLRGTVQRNDVTARVRDRTEGALQRIRDGAQPKPAPVKIKSGSELDTYIGLDPGQKDLVPWKPEGDWTPPSRDLAPDNWPADTPWDDDAFDAVNSRYNQRVQEFADNKDTVNQLVADGRARANPDNGTLEWNLTEGRRMDDGDFVPIAGDHDIFEIEVNVPADVRAMGPDEVERYIAQVKQDVIHDLSAPPFGAQHGDHLSWVVPETRAAQTINARILSDHTENGVLTVAKDTPAHITRYENDVLPIGEIERLYPD